AVRQALDLTRANLDAARRSVLDLRAAPLEGRMLVEALSALAHETSTPDLAVDLETVGGQRPLPARIEVGLYRVAQAALANVVRHAQARHVRLRLVGTPDHVTLTVEDDGRGFDPSQTAENRYGLAGMNERAKLLGGTFAVDSCPGEGTRIDVVVPLE
ncbi:MAG: sensor histidine kinase, partial [bacterium]|nr:sensor histidine kinase [bacterium]